ncbi:MAG: DNA-processing protein DprA [Mediterranea sp.]|jgi:DNA processing protein|nr:DNA-processing protein DprA [Mediterranea sp.]
MNEAEHIHTIALMLVPGIGVVRSRSLIDAMGSAERVFLNRREIPDALPGVSPRIVDLLNCPQAIARAEKEYEFVRKNKIRCLAINDEDYPSRLRECDDAPVILFFKGNTDLNVLRVVNMVGTRKATDYGKQICNRFLQEMKELCPDILVVSGLAYGIDIQAHHAALRNNISTVGILAHGLDRIYPPDHRNTAAKMIEKGGLLTEFITETSPDRYNFVSRNRIVAGMSDATIVVESAVKGGSLITASLARGYHRDCFAFPGRHTDTQSQGCNRLIQNNEAALIQSAEDLVMAMRWNDVQKKPKNVQPLLFPELTEEEEAIVALISKHEKMHINELVAAAGIPVYRMSVTLLELEMKRVLQALPGNVYRLIC